VYGTSFSGKGSDFKVTQLRPENCGDADARFNSDVNDAKNNVMGAMDGVIANDLSKVTSDLTGLPNVVAVKDS
jgi:hypothetical protein